MSLIKSIIIIGDIHGSYKTLMALIAKFPPGIPIVFVGDLVDRGPDSRRVVQFIIENGHECVKGNHEQMMINHVDDTTPPEWKGQWSDFERNGGEATLKSYENFPEDLKAPNREWAKDFVYDVYRDIVLSSDCPL